MDGTILIADDDRTIRTVLTQAFTRAGCRVHATASLMTLMRWVEEGRGDLVISDVIMPDGNGLETLPRIAALRADLPVIIISAQNTIMTAIKAAEAEAFDYLPKPFDLPELMKRAGRALVQRRKTSEVTSTPSGSDGLPLIGRSAVMQELYRVVARVINTDLPVLISGESGTGKSLLARAIHDYSDRRNAPFVVVGAAECQRIETIHDFLSKSRRGTVLFDEIGDLSPEAQATLVRALDAEKEDHARLLASTQENLASRVEEGGFRADLYYRISAVDLTVPALRSRLDDIELLAIHFLDQLRQDTGEHKSFAPQAFDKLRLFDWPGNIRQLENVVQRLALTSPQDEISALDTAAVLGGNLHQKPRSPASGPLNLSQSIGEHLQRYFDLHGDGLPPEGLYSRILKEMELPLLEISLLAAGGNQAKCADLLGINRNTLRKKLTELDINVTRRRKLM